jgi:hypothetical protein
MNIFGGKSRKIMERTRNLLKVPIPSLVGMRMG